MLEYVEDYEGFAIYQDTDDGYYLSLDKEGKQISREATKTMVLNDINRYNYLIKEK